MEWIDLKNWQLIKSSIGFEDWITAIAYSPDGQKLAITVTGAISEQGSASDSSQVAIIDNVSQTLQAERAVGLSPTMLEFTRDGSALVVYGSAENPDDQTSQVAQVALLDSTTLEPLWSAPLAGVFYGTGADVIAFVSARSHWSPLRPESAQFWRSGAIVVREDGAWELVRTHEVVRSTREAVRNRVGDLRRWAAMRPDTAAMEAHRQRIERERTAHARELAAMRRVLVHAFPATRPRAVALVDVGAREVTTFLGDEITPALQRLSEYDIIGAVNVRALLRELGVDYGKRRLAELGPPQKTIQLNRRGRILTITTALLIQGSCGISRPLGDERTMREYLRSGAIARAGGVRHSR